MNTTEQNQAALAQAIKAAKEEYAPAMFKELWVQLAKEYKVKYDCFKREGFTTNEALRLVAGYYE